MKQKSTLAKKLASYSSLASVILIASKSSDAQIIYTDVNPDTTINLGDSYLLDLNNDGINDFRFNLIPLSTGGNQARVVGYSGNSIARDTINHPYTFQYYAYADTIPNGNLIGGSHPFYYEEILGTYYTFATFGNFANVIDHFMGLKVIVNSNAYYGWARISIPLTCDHITINDYAMDTIPDHPIKAGDKCGNYSAYVTTVINPSDSITVCEGEAVIIATDAVAGGTYQWLLNDIPIAGATDLTYAADSSGEYNVIVSNAYGCADTASAVPITVNPLPAVPVISQAGNDLSSTSANSYQWYRFGVLIPGATDQTFTPTEGGEYTVVITDGNGCSNTSESFTFIPIGIAEQENIHASVFQSGNTIFIHLNDEKLLGATFNIFNQLGDDLYDAVLDKADAELNLDYLPAGIYILSLNKKDHKIVRKILIQ